MSYDWKPEDHDPEGVTIGLCPQTHETVADVCMRIEGLRQQVIGATLNTGTERRVIQNVYRLLQEINIFSDTQPTCPIKQELLNIAGRELAIEKDADPQMSFNEVARLYLKVQELLATLFSAVRTRYEMDITRG